MTTENSRADALTEAVTRTIETIKRQLDLIVERAPGDFLDKRPVVQSLSAHVRRLEKALAASPVEQPAAAAIDDEQRIEAVARATIMDACQSISRSADGVKAGCAIGDEWPDAEDKAFYDAELRLLGRLTALLAAHPGQPAPIDMLLFCPKCGVQHIDAEEWHDDPHDIEQGQIRVWDNPPHRSHLCHACGTIWRPADVPTNGVAAIQTRGKADTSDGKPEPASRSVIAAARAVIKADRSQTLTTEHVDALDNAIRIQRGELKLPEPRAEVTDAMIAAAAKTLSDRSADACNINRDDNWMIYGEQFQQDAMAALEAAEAARAGDAS
ncbi:hypothetical protein [Burkholderia sp. YIM B11467]